MSDDEPTGNVIAGWAPVTHTPVWNPADVSYSQGADVELTPVGHSLAEADEVALNEAAHPIDLLHEIAAKISAKLAALSDYSAAKPPKVWAEITRFHRIFTYALKRGWRGQARLALTAMQQVQADVYFQTESWRSGMVNLAAPQRLAPLPEEEIYQELLAAQREFGEVGRKYGEVYVTTRDITIEGVPLGPFRLYIDINRLGSSIPLRAEALKPNPAAGTEFTHPHVDSEAVCLGDGVATINQALLDGRFCDAFLMINAVLQQEGGNPYLPIEDWGGRHCSDCGEPYDEDEGCTCECGETRCGACSGCCERCGATTCGECQCVCEGCGYHFCENCAKNCSECGNQFCRGCLDDGLCQDCVQDRAEAEEEARAEVQPDGVGEADPSEGPRPD